MVKSKASKAMKSKTTKARSKATKSSKSVSKINKKTNKMDFETVIARIRDVLRSVGITGMGSINHCILFVMARYMDEDMCKKLGVSEIYSYDNMMKDEEEGVEAEILLQRFCSSYDDEDPFLKVAKIDMKFTNIDFKMKKNPNELKEIMKLLSKIDIHHLSEKYDVIGTIYELHLRTGSTSSMRDLGQYFTHRLVIKYMVELCDPSMNKKTKKIETIVDPTMGTGGFLTMAMKHLNNKYSDIDWTKNKDRVYGFDIDDSVRNMAALNCLLEVGEFFSDTIMHDDTLRNDMMVKGKLLEKADIILANEPMGLKGLKYDDCCQRIKDLKIKGTKAEPLFMQLFMQSLNDGGRCAVVVPDGVLFNEAKLFKSTRKYLIENFNLKKVTALDGDFFLNTGVKTSILFFEKNGKTKEVEFCKISLKDNDIQEDVIVKAAYDKLVEEDYSLFVNRYNNESVVNNYNIQYMKTDEIFKMIIGKARTKDASENGKYPFYNGSAQSPVGKCSILSHLQDSKYILLIKDGGAGVGKYSDSIGLGKSFIVSGGTSFTTSVVALVNEKKECLIEYLYHYLTLSKNKLMDLANYTVGLGHMTLTKFKKFEIPIPPLEVQNAIVERLDLLSENIKTMEKNIEEFDKVMNYYISNHIAYSNKNMKLGDISQVKGGKRIPKGKTYSNAETDYHYLQVGDMSSGRSESRYISKDIYDILQRYKLDIGDIILSIAGTIGSVDIYNSPKNTILTENACKIVNIYDSVNSKYLYFILKSSSVQNIMKQKYKQATIPKLSLASIKNILIPIPPLEKQKEIVSYCDNIQNMIEQFEKQIESNKQLQKDIMDGYLKMCSDSAKKEDENNDTDDTDDTDDDSYKPKKRKTKSKPKEVTKTKKVIKTKKVVREMPDESEETDDETSEDPFEQPKKKVVKKKTKTKSKSSRPGTKKKPVPKRKAVVRKAKR